MGGYVSAIWPANPTGSTRAQRTPCKYKAYLPDFLSPLRIELPAEVSADLVDVEQQVRAIGDGQVVLNNLEPLARFLLRAEAVASSNIEGLRLGVRRLAHSEAAEREGVPVNDEVARAVLGNIRAIDAAVRLAADSNRNVSVEDLRDLHRALLQGTRDEPWAGHVRTEQNWIGGSSPCVAAFVPPPPGLVPDLLEDLADYISGDAHPALLQAALAHAQFETIHPFADGNGRTGRAIIQLILRRRGLAQHVQPPISLVLATQADAYVHALDGTRTEDATQAGLLSWLELFLSSTGRACQDTERFAKQLNQLQATWAESVGRPRADSATSLLLHALPSLPVFSITTAAARIGRTFQATSDAVQRLLEGHVVRQVSLGRRNRAFEVVGLFEAFTDYERLLASPHSDTQMSPPSRPVPARPNKES